MRRWIRTRWVAVTAALLASAAALAVEFRADEELVLEGPRDDMVFAAARRVAVRAQSVDDLFVAGATVAVDGARADRLALIGETLLFQNFEAKDLVAAGRQLELLGGVVTDDVLAAGAMVTLGAGAQIRGSAVLSGVDVIVESPVGAELRAAGERVRVNGVVGGDVELAGHRVFIGPNARIGGRLTHRAEMIEIDPAAQIAGEVVALEPRATDVTERWAGKAIATAIVFGLAFVLGVVALMTLLAALLPSLMRESAARMGAQPLATLGLGVLIAFAAPAVIALCIATIIGIPIALVLIAVLAALAPIAIAASAYYLGRQASGLAQRGAPPAEPRLGARLGWTALAVLALLIVGALPFVGGLAWMAAYVFGLGAVAVVIARALSRGSQPVVA